MQSLRSYTQLLQVLYNSLCFELNCITIVHVIYNFLDNCLRLAFTLFSHILHPHPASGGLPIHKV